jgi:ABC-type amino acid transport substrate-binding protein
MIAIAVIVFALGHFLTSSHTVVESKTEAVAVKTETAAAHESAYERVLRTKTIRCGYTIWPPAIYKEPNTGQLSGINYDFMEAIGREMQVKVDWAMEVSYADLAQALNTGKIDMVCASIWPDYNRASQVEYTMPTYYSGAWAYVRANDTRFDNNREKINQPDVKAAGIEGDVSLQVAQVSFPNATHISLPQAADGSLLITTLLSNKADIVFIDEPLARNFLKANPGTIKKVEGLSAIRTFGEHLLVPNQEYKFKQAVEVATLTLINSGVMDDILKKYDGSFIPPAKFTDSKTLGNQTNN